VYRHRRPEAEVIPDTATMRTLLLYVLAMLVIAGCTMFQRTPEQHRVYERYETVCRREYPGHQLTSTRP